MPKALELLDDLIIDKGDLLIKLGKDKGNKLL